MGTQINFFFPSLQQDKLNLLSKEFIPPKIQNHLHVVPYFYSLYEISTLKKALLKSVLSKCKPDFSQVTLEKLYITTWM